MICISIISEKEFDTRSKEELLMHFIQLPIKNITNISLDEEPKAHLDNLNQIEPNIFSDFSNPIL